MKSKKLDNGGIVLILDAGDEVVSTLTTFARQNHIGGAHFTAIGPLAMRGSGTSTCRKRTT
jgi:predicted DNA-binding protein with PD1-like motif